MHVYLMAYIHLHNISLTNVWASSSCDILDFQYVSLSIKHLTYMFNDQIVKNRQMGVYISPHHGTFYLLK